MNKRIIVFAPFLFYLITIPVFSAVFLNWIHDPKRISITNGFYSAAQKTPALPGGIYYQVPRKIPAPLILGAGSIISVRRVIILAKTPVL